jgi:hypothetical protein
MLPEPQPYYALVGAANSLRGPEHLPMQKHSPLPGMLAGLLLTTSALVAQATEQAVSDSSGSRVLRNGPFHRTFLDGYFPFHVRL